ncbi:hypothetical protein LXL04_025803 [Taraxacum kok-saghyz]
MEAAEVGMNRNNTGDEREGKEAAQGSGQQQRRKAGDRKDLAQMIAYSTTWLYRILKTFFAGEGSSSVPRSRGRKDGDTIWLPDGWTMEVEAKSSRQKYKLYIGPNEKKSISMPMVLSYLASINSSPAGQKEGPVKSQTSADKYWVEDVCCCLDSKIKMSFSCNLSFGKLVLQVFDVMSQRESKVKKQEISQDYSSQQLRVYNRFLKEGRLTGCLEKLEYLDRKGLLDMSNVMVNSRIEPNVHTYGALIDGCAKAGQIYSTTERWRAQFFATFIEVVRDRPPGHDWELEPGVTCGDYLFGMLQVFKKIFSIPFQSIPVQSYKYFTRNKVAFYSNSRESITVTTQEVTPK